MKQRFTNLEITNGRNWWTVTGWIDDKKATLTTVHGDISDVSGIRDALAQHFGVENLSGTFVWRWV